MNFTDFLSKIQYKFTDEEEQLLQKAFDFAKKAHAGQIRFSGEDYFEHPVEAAIILADILPSAPTVAATLLHDVPEDTKITLDEIRKEFGEEIASLVDGVTKLGKVRLRNSKDQYYVENLRKMFIATSKDIRVILIKLADRLHNMRTLQFVRKEKQKRIAEETLEIFAPIASRLGIGEWKDELEDLSFQIVFPEEFKKTEALLKNALHGRDKALKKLQKNVAEILRTEGVKFEDLQGRVKRVYSLHKKLDKYGGDIHKIYDLVALRVITKSTVDCYSALGAIHKHLQLLPGRVKDFIALPKSNGYKSIHTTVFDNHKNIFEIQIRTEQMHDEAEKGIAAHWYYEEGDKADKLQKMRVQWVQDLHDMQNQMNNPEEFLNALKIDFFQKRIFVLTPKGDVRDLPEGATPIDFAFSIHSNLGFYMQGVKVNGKMVKIDHALKSGDVVEIIKSKKPVTISNDWLKQAKTSNARSKIRHYLEEHQTGIFNSLKKLINRK
ncbi:MAG: relA [Candidatus Doudnabacteria bacterium]|nr:relA [Candidatus Doudnabacteria bacterium]